MNKNRQRWVYRKTLEGDVYYDTDTRKVYRNGGEEVQAAKQDYFSLPTFDPRAPLKTYFDFTYLCNLECRHCITNSSPRVDRRNELPPERICSIMDELAAVGVLEIAVGGGEPLCHSHIFSFLDHARAIGLNVVVTTNGVLITAEIAKRLKECQVSEVRVSFDGSQKVHDSIRGVGNYQKAIRAVKFLIQSGVRIMPHLTICNDDKLGLDILFRELAATGAGTLKANLLRPLGRATLKENQELFRYSRDTGMSEYLLELAQKHGLELRLPDDGASVSKTADGQDLRRGKRRSCGAGLVTVYISPSGDVQPCSGMTNKVFGNVRSNPFMSAWTGETANAWRQFANSHDSFFACGEPEKTFISLGAAQKI